MGFTGLDRKQAELTLREEGRQSIFDVDDSSDLPIWVQLRNRMAYLVRTGAFAEGEQLPSVRSLAAEAKINYNTVTKAYRDLEMEGLIVNVRGRGMFVRKDLPENEKQEAAAADALLDDCIQQYRSAGMTFEEIERHISTIVAEKRKNADKVTREKMEYRDAH